MSFWRSGLNSRSTARAEFSKWFQPDLLETYLDGLRKAGLDIAATSEPDRSSTPARVGRSDAPGAAPADEGFWVAVLPFKYSGGNADLTSLAEGLSEEIVTGLSRFSYLRVLARGSGERLKARYVIEGSIRQAGSQLRVCGATHRRQFRCASLGRDLRPAFPCRVTSSPCRTISSRGSSPRSLTRTGSCRTP